MTGGRDAASGELMAQSQISWPVKIRKPWLIGAAPPRWRSPV
jgi:hypothetical protein